MVYKYGHTVLSQFTRVPDRWTDRQNSHR